MQKAFDTILQTEVLSTLAAKSGGFEQYRYECACCGEEVYIAASHSTKIVAHFRHRNGNNDIECENYLGQFGMLSLSTEAHSRKSDRERVEFYFENTNKIFSIGLKFSENEIRNYEEESVGFALRTKDSDKPFKILKIDMQKFAPEVSNMIPLSTLSCCYYISNTCGGTERKYEFLNHSSPTFFKILGHDETFKARLVHSASTSAVLYTNVSYFVAILNENIVDWPSEEVEISANFRFETMGHRFNGVVLKIKDKTPKVSSLLDSWGYKLEASETLTLLWPPASIRDDITEIASDVAFLYTSFELQAHGNINLRSDDIVRSSAGISKIAVKKKTKIYRKNAEIVIDKRQLPIVDFDNAKVTQVPTKLFEVPAESDYYIFNRSGVSPLSKGQRIPLTPKSMIKHYLSGYLVMEIHLPQPQIINGKELLNDILNHYKRVEKFDITIFTPLNLSDTASEYMLEAKSTGVINTIAKKYILEGKL